MTSFLEKKLKQHVKNMLFEFCLHSSNILFSCNSLLQGFLSNPSIEYHLILCQALSQIIIYIFTQQVILSYKFMFFLTQLIDIDSA